MTIRHQLSYLRSVMGIMHGSKAFGGPFQANISLTNRCNIRCNHCYFYSPYIDQPNLVQVRKAREKGEKLPDNEELKHIQTLDISQNKLNSLIDELLKMGTRHFQLSAKGEPFLYKHILEGIARLKHSGSHCFINTNGILLDKVTINELIKLKFDELRITVMAGTAEVYIRTHQGTTEKTFLNIKDNLLYLSLQKKQLAVNKPKVILVFIVTSQNADNIIEFSEFANLVGAQGVLFRPVDDIGDQGLAKVVPTQEQSLLIQKQLVEAKLYLESKGISNNISNFQKVFSTQLDTRALYRQIPCYYGWLSVNIYLEGEVYPCCRCYNSLGNIYKESFHQIWNGKLYREFRKNALQIHKNKKPVNGCDCYSCVHHTANLRVYQMLHPIKGRSTQIKQLASVISSKKE